MRVAMLGAGAFGTVLGNVLTENGHVVKYYDPALGTILEDVLDGAEVMVLCVPSHVAPKLLPFLPVDLPLIVTTKGFLSDDVFSRFKNVMVLSGPGFAKDIADHKETLLTATNDLIPQLFENEYMKFDHSDDVKGVLMCGALKNVYAIEAGFRGFDVSSEEMRQFIEIAADEMALTLGKNGANPDTVKCACGIGDLILTCSPDSRNFEFGSNLAKDSKYKPEKTLEGVSALKRILEGAILVPETATILNDLIIRSKEWD